MKRHMLALLAIGLLIAACGPNPRANVRAADTPTATPQSLPTGADATATVTSEQAKPCDASGGPAGSVRLGDLVLWPLEVNLAFAQDFVLPGGLPDKPLAVTIKDNESYLGETQVVSMPVAGAQGFILTVCNASRTTAHQLTSFSAKIASLAPYSGQLNTLNGCAFLYARAGGYGGECASGFQADVETNNVFASNATAGATAIWAPASPVVVPSGQHRDVVYFMTPPSGTVRLTYQLGVSVDAGALTYPFSPTLPEIIAPIARKWDGRACSSAAMQAQIPASSPTGVYYVCPAAA